MPERSDHEAMTTEQASQYTGFSESFLRQSRCYGNRPGRTPGPPYFKVGRAVRYRRSDLDAWLDAHRVEPQGVEEGA